MRLAYAFMLCAACSVQRGPSLQLHVGSMPPAGMPNARCGPLVAGGDALSTYASNAKQTISTMRVTLVAARPNDKPLFCDRLFGVDSSPPYFKLPDSDASSVSIFVEAFGPAGPGDRTTAGGMRRVAYGAVTDIAPGDNTFGPLRLYPAEDFRCAPSQISFPRAFHTATLLPDGRVLLVGGLASNETIPGQPFSQDGATATGNAEIWDPRTGASLPVTDASPTPLPRAFHSAALLNQSSVCMPGELAILLVGGLTPGPMDANNPTHAILNPSHSLPGSRLQPFSQGTIPSPLDAEPAGNEMLCLNPTTLKSSHHMIGGTAAAYRASTSSADGFVIAGGETFDYTLLNQPTYIHALDVFPLDGAMELTGATTNDRHAATLTSLGNGQALLWGGNTYGDPVGEILSALPTTPYSAPLGVTATSTEFATATRLEQAGDPTILITGGFEIVNGGVNTQPPVGANAVRVLTVTSGVVTAATVPFSTNTTTNASYASVVSCTDPTHYKSAGFESAVPLSRGRALVTGGAPSTTNATSHCQDCVGTVQSALCAIGQASTYTDGALVPAPPMMVPRYGHTSTTLHDGTILIIGGIGNQVDAMNNFASAVFLTDVEIYNPRTLVPPYDSSMTTPVDADDPAADALTALGYTRAPGAQAVSTTSNGKPVKSCDSL